MSASPSTVAATLRGKAAVSEVRQLFDQLEDIDVSISMHGASDAHLSLPYNITYDEIAEVLQRRRDAVLTKLENKGIRVAPDPIEVAA